jgi:hypothetical protein
VIFPFLLALVKYLKPSNFLQKKRLSNLTSLLNPLLSSLSIMNVQVIKMTEKLIVVFGATGGQGGSVVTTYLNELGWKVRGITRNARSTRAEALKARGVEVVQADLDDLASLAQAIEGAQAIFGVTDYWGLFGNILTQQGATVTQPIDELAKEAEAQQLKNLIDMAAKSPILERFIISSLPNITKLSNGKYPNVYPYNGKAEAVDYIEENYLDLWSKTSVYRPGYFLVNFIDQPMGQPQKVRYK